MGMRRNEAQVMLDLETWSTRKDAAIASIGAVKFNFDEIISEFYVNIEIDSNKTFGRHFDRNTIDWWMSKPKETLAALKVDPKPLDEALTTFAEWFGPKSLKVWGNSNEFDNVVLGSAFEATGIQQPWKYWDSMDYRTLLNMFNLTKNEFQSGMYHNALHDARFQTEQLQKLLRLAC